jgi:hypothetical protein
MSTIAYKTVFSCVPTILNHDDGMFTEFELFFIRITNVSNFGVLKLNTDFISSTKEDLFCDVFINKILFCEFVSSMVKRKNVLFEKIVDDKNISNICKKLIKDKKFKSFIISDELVELKNIEYKIISMTNGNEHIVILF